MSCAPLRCGANRSAWSCWREWPRGAPWWPRISRGTGRPQAGMPSSCRRATSLRCHGRSVWRWPTPPRGVGGPRWTPSRRRRPMPRAGRWRAWPSATSTSTSGPSRPTSGASTPRADPYTQCVLTVIGPSGGTGTVHDGGTHPERQARIDAVMAGIADLAPELGSELEIVSPERADAAALERVHAAGYLHRLEEFCLSGGGNLDLD